MIVSKNRNRYLYCKVSKSLSNTFLFFKSSAIISPLDSHELCSTKKIITQYFKKKINKFINNLNKINYSKFKNALLFNHQQY